MNKVYDEKITKWISENKDRMISYWCDLIRIPSIKSEAAPNTPFGENCAKALSCANDIFIKEGFESRIFPESGYSLAAYGSGTRKIGLFSHSDVVPVGGDWIFTEPFAPIIKEGSLIGRGSEDNKSGIIASLCLFEILRDCDIPLKSALEAFVGSDEECGMGDLINYLKEQKMPDISIVPDADFPCSVGEKGIYHFWCKSRNAFKSIIDFKGGEAFNIVLDDVAVTLRLDDKLLNELTDSTQGRPEFSVLSNGETITLIAKGVAKHASIPEGSVNAAYLAAKLLSECKSLPEDDREILLSAADILSCCFGGGIGVIHEDEAFGRLTSVNGMVKTEDGKLCLSFDCRYGDTLDGTYLENESERVLESKGFIITYKDNRPGFKISEDSTIPSLLENIYEEVTSERLGRVLMSGGTYARRLKNAFSVGAFIVRKDRTTPVLSMPEGHGGPHQCDERIDIDAFFEAVRVLVHYVIGIDKEINS